jgi:uncharacterized protein YndB with AHSA1/START domain
MMGGMRFAHSVKYDAPIDEVYAMLSDPDFRQRSCAHMGVLTADVQITPQGKGVSIVIDQVQPTEGVPSFAKRFAGATTRAIQREVWDDPNGASFEIETPGKPTSVTGWLTLAESDGGTTETLSADVRVRVPLIGGKLEGLMGDLIERGMEKEHEVGVAWLKGER